MVADRIVILREGRIEQIGSPQEIYTNPKSIFVMSFVGGANFFDGVISHVDKLGSIVDLRGGLRIRTCSTTGRVGDRIVIAIRRENVHLRKSRMKGFNNLIGEIADVMFVGGSMEYIVRLENGMSIMSRILLEGKGETLKRGDIVIVSFHPRDCHVFPYPERGLLKEIEAI